MNKAMIYGVLMFCVGLSAGTYHEYLELNQKFNDMPVVEASVEQRIVNLPEDGKLYYTSLFLPANWQADPKSRELRAWFDTNVTLASLRSQTHFNVVTTADAQWRTKYAPSVGQVPCIALTDAAGDVVFKACSGNIPNDAKVLATAVSTAVSKRCPNRRCPTPEPVKPEPEPVQPDTAPILDTKVPDLTPPAEEFPLWLGLVLGLVGIGAAVVPDVVKKYKAVG